MKNSLKVVLILSLIFVGLYCSDNPTDPYEDASDMQALYLDLFNVTDYDSIQVYVADSAEASIDLALEAADSSTLTVDGDDIYVISGDSTVTEDVEITIDCKKVVFIQGTDSSKFALAFSCLPESLTFNDALVIDVPTAGFNNHPTANAIKLLLYDPDSNRWNVVATGHKTNPREQFSIEHFSKYAISD